MKTINPKIRISKSYGNKSFVDCLLNAINAMRNKAA